KAIPINLDETKNIPQDAKLSKMLKPFIDKSKELMGEKIGETLGPLPLRRYQESALFNLITDAVKLYTDADVVIQNVGGVRDGFKVGPITRGDVYSAIPFNNEIFVFEMKGAELKEILEFAASQYGVNGFAQLSGARWSIDTNSKKILNLTVAGLSILSEKIYEVATLDYLVEGGDGYIFFKKLSNQNFFETGLFNREILTQYITEKKRIIPLLDGRLQLVKMPIGKLFLHNHNK
ncbi:MAG: 5'-nucleotidase C-terminal domain-containing protein, partial [Candidatus Helarchaeota archaeon]|nr:5'-nucleotidase C-terminal domain-containing protein [Candidatus Helarchaeota archaeon]